MNTKELNEFLREITLATKLGELKQIFFECDNCTLSILTCSHFDSAEMKTVEIGIKNKENTDFFKMPNGFYKDDEDYKNGYYDFNASIMHYVPIIGIPLVLKAFYHASEDDISNIYDSFEFITSCCL